MKYREKLLAQGKIENRRTFVAQRPGDKSRRDQNPLFLRERALFLQARCCQVSGRGGRCADCGRTRQRTGSGEGGGLACVSKRATMRVWAAVEVCGNFRNSVDIRPDERLNAQHPRRAFGLATQRDAGRDRHPPSVQRLEPGATETWNARFLKNQPRMVGGEGALLRTGIRE